MISIPYLKQTIKSNLLLFLGFTAILCAFLTVICNIFTPTSMSGIETAVNGTFASNIITGNTFVEFLSNSFYAIMAILFPMLYSIIVGNNLIASKVDDGSMANYLSTPVSRGKIVVSSALYLALSLALMWVIASIVGITVAEIVQPDSLDIDTFLMLNVGAFLYHFAISSICFAASCIFDSSKTSLVIGGGIPLCFFIINLLVKLSEDLEVLKYATLTTLFNTSNIIGGSDYIGDFILLAVIGIVLYVIGIEVFKRKSLPL
ncbi:hypothetical protein TL18_06665 [Methanobrevibacter sp. YE315]|uniref:ABC transporter permease subunit n=1 Tax=Methanobrevibacter sp. YE315 TaxID=1609968 RepID=UPI000764F26A|nr:ABC transporter permease subunit [Methanobrevibacter sp. YE315]AMD17730.1 hypothetical protein TL18_06665 [Methanobrevibacter sp. YE315]